MITAIPATKEPAVSSTFLIPRQLLPSPYPHMLLNIKRKC